MTRALRISLAVAAGFCLAASDLAAQRVPVAGDTARRPPSDSARPLPRPGDTIRFPSSGDERETPRIRPTPRPRIQAAPPAPPATTTTGGDAGRAGDAGREPAAAATSRDTAAAAGDTTLRAWQAARADTLTIGDHVTLVARVAAPRGTVVTAALLRSDTAALEVIDGPRVAAAPDGTHAVGLRTVVWAVGEVSAPIVRLTVTSGDETRTLDVPLRVPHVRSVLPADSAGIQPRPAKDVLDLPRPSWVGRWLPFAVAAALALLVAWGIARWRRRAPADALPVDARAAALAELARAGDAGWIERGELRALYVAVSGAVRAFAAHLSPRWGAERTTEELAREMAAGGAPQADVAALAAVLRRADLVKFARHTPKADEAAADLAAARAWVSRAEAPVAADGAREPTADGEAAA